MPIDTQAGRAQNAKLLHQAQPQVLIWASRESTGGAGPIDPAGLPTGCQPVQMLYPLRSPQEPANDQAATRDAADHSATAKHVGQQLSELLVEWETLTVGKSWLPFCYVMYTSGSTGAPVGVCGTETGWAASSRRQDHTAKLNQLICFHSCAVALMITCQACYKECVRVHPTDSCTLGLLLPACYQLVMHQTYAGRWCSSVLMQAKHSWIRFYRTLMQLSCLDSAENIGIPQTLIVSICTQCVAMHLVCDHAISV